MYDSNMHGESIKIQSVCTLQLSKQVPCTSPHALYISHKSHDYSLFASRFVKRSSNRRLRDGGRRIERLLRTACNSAIIA